MSKFYFFSLSLQKFCNILQSNNFCHMVPLFILSKIVSDDHPECQTYTSHFLEIKTASSSLALNKVLDWGEIICLRKNKHSFHSVFVFAWINCETNNIHWQLLAMSLPVWNTLVRRSTPNWTEQSLTKHLQPSDPGLNL